MPIFMIHGWGPGSEGDRLGGGLILSNLLVPKFPQVFSLRTFLPPAHSQGKGKTAGSRHFGNGLPLLLLFSPAAEL